MAFLYKRSITIDKTKVPNTDQTNFPMVVTGTYAYLKTTANGGKVENANGYDIGFYADFGLSTKLKWETKKWIATTGEVIYWVKVPTVTTAVDTVIYLAYGDASITTNQSDPTNVWDSDYKGVWHMEDNAANTTVLDSTSFANNGTAQANTSTKTATGQVGAGLSFNGSSDYIYTDDSYVNPSTYTIEAWIKTTGDNDAKVIGFENTQTGDGTSYDRMLYLAPGNAGKITHGWYDGSTKMVTSTNSVADNNWHYVVGTHNATTGRLYVDGVSQGSDTGAPQSYTGWWRMGYGNLTGWGGAGSAYYLGTMDETRVSHAARSGDWIVTSYNNQSNPATFYTIGGEIAGVSPTITGILSITF